MKTLPIVALACAALTGIAFGQTITQTRTFSGVPDFSQPLLFNQFNGPASNLTNINVSYSITISGGQFIVDNDSNTPATTTATFGAKLNASSSDVVLVDTGFQPIFQSATVTNSETFNLGPDNGDGVGNYDSSGPDGAILVGTTKISTGGGDINPGAYGATGSFIGYIGAGQFTINALTDQVGSLSFNSGIETASTPVNASGFVTVTYTVVPEPSSAALLGLAAAALAFRRRRA